MSKFKVTLGRSVSGIESSLTVEIKAECKDQAAFEAEKQFPGWKLQKVTA